MRLSPAAFRRFTLASAVALGLIVVTGAAVRLTGSGLGCSTWPTCEPGRLVPPWGMHAWVEFGNRLVTLAVGVVVVATLAAALLRRDRRSDLTLLSAGLVAGVVGQAVVGGLSVRYDLLPGWVMAHFLLSMLVLADALALHVRAGGPGGRRRGIVRREVRWLAASVVVVAGVVLTAGTVVTGTGPHAGDARAVRLPLPLEKVAQAHADLAFLLTGMVLATVLALRLGGAPRAARRLGAWLAGLVVAQVAVGLAQYALALPAGLVGVHVALATALWSVSVLLLLSLSAPAAVTVPPAQVRPGSAQAARAQAPARSSA